MKKIILSGVLFSSVYFADAQSLEQFLIASGGGANTTLQWSVGEIMIETQSNSENVLTQGFHQTLLTITAIDENSISDIEFLVYPNPFRSSINIHQSKGSFSPVLFTLTDLSGKLLLSQKLQSATEEFNLESLASGIYFLNIQQADESIRSYKVVKQN